MKELGLNRFKGDIKALTEQIEKLQDEIYEKNSAITNLKQEIFKLKREAEETASDQIGRL
jgi:peptidoglycan hydrolase CwlO-like protein